MDTLLSLLDDTATAARTTGREDLVARLESAAIRLRDPRRRIIVAGHPSQGKSRFINALLNQDICPVGDDATTTIPLQLAYAPHARAELVLSTTVSDETRVEFPIEELAQIDARAAGKTITRIDLHLPNDLLADGIVIIDTPGIGTRGRSVGVLEMLPTADAVLMVTDASTELTAPELTFLRQVHEFGVATAVLVTKTDLYPHWRQVFEADREHLAQLALPVLPISALLRTHALRRQDAQLGAESGFGELFQFLREVVTRKESATRRTIACEISSAAEHLTLALGSELAALRDPQHAATTIAELEAAKATAQQLHRRTAAWQQTLADGITDLAGDVDHDLRERLRTISRTGEEWIDDHDPGRHWQAIAEWLTGTVDTALGDNLLWAHARAETLAERVAEHFQELGTTELPALAIEATHQTGTLAELEPDIGVVSKVLVGMRGSYGGVLMVGLATTFAGLAMLNPLSIGAGVLVGGKAYRDDKQARLTRRRAEAKNAVRRFLDDIAFHAAKDTKDRTHHIHRTLRDHYAGIAERTLRSIDESLTAAQQSAGIKAADRDRRTAILEHQLATLRHRTAQLHVPTNA
ncbi:dynamin family protein [Nocardia sp. NPDC058666]|uniref:dynamin family protein n=1 Tax=Nocardia sp. NPDC058666 TaxID=3346587 RepID=UPI003652FDD0